MLQTFEIALTKIDTLHAQDPRQITSPDGATIPHELAYARQMSHWLEQVHDAPSELLRLAVRAQHLQRWQLPRENYPTGRVGYLTWRRDQSTQAGETAAALMQDAGYTPSDSQRVATIIRKQGLGRDPEVQALEDCACLVFLERYFADFSQTVERDHMIRIVQKTWRKMSPKAHALAVTLPMTPFCADLVKDALAAVE